MLPFRNLDLITIIFLFETFSAHIIAGKILSMLGSIIVLLGNYSFDRKRTKAKVKVKVYGYSIDQVEASLPISRLSL